MSVSYNVKELFSGVLNKCGGKVKSWNRRWFVLKSDYCLYYYKDPAKGHLGVISLRDPKFNVRKGSASDIAWPKGITMDCTMAVVTSHRTYFMYSVTREEAEEWRRILDSTRVKLVDEANAANRLLSGSRPHSATTTGDKQDSTRTKLLSDSALPGLDEQEMTYEAVYDSPEVDLSQNESNHSSPNPDINGTRQVNTLEVCRDTSKSGRSQTCPVGEYPHSIYDLANAVENHHDDVSASQPLYSEAAPVSDKEKKVENPNTVYDDIEIHHTNNTKRQEVEGPGAMYDDVEVLYPGGSRNHIQNGKDSTLGMHGTLGMESPQTPSARNLPLPPVPLAVKTHSAAGAQPIYEDILESSRAGCPQPLYDAVTQDDSVDSHRYVQEADKSDDEGHTNSAAPPLPSKDDLPPLPPKDNLPLLPPKDTVPELPPKSSPPSMQRGGKSVPTLPPKTKTKQPELPQMEHTVNQQSRHGNVPPLTFEDDGKQSHQPVVSPRHNQPSSRQVHGSGEGSSLSPSSQKKPVPRERTLTPPPNKKPSPVPRKRASPSPGIDASVTRPTVNGHSATTAVQPLSSPVLVEVTSPTDRETQQPQAPSEFNCTLFRVNELFKCHC